MKPSQQSNTMRNITISGLIIFFMLLCGFLGFILIISNFTRNQINPAAVITVIPYYPDLMTSIPTKTTESISLNQTSNQSAIFAKGMTIYIRGTGGDGLRLRDVAGQSGLTLYIAGEGQDYTIIDGPDLRDGFVWWRIRNNENGEIIGWGVQDFMTTN